MDTVIHECLHACLPDLSEEATLETATDICCVLRRLKARIEVSEDV